MALAIVPGLIFGPSPVRAGGVTLITHGFNGNVTDWVIPMCDRIPQYSGFAGTNVSEYQISITRTGTVYYVGQNFLDGTSPATSDSGEIIIALDWSSLSGGAVPTTAIATQAVAALLATNLIPELGGHPLAELPMHLAGHSRGGSVVMEMARLLGAQGLWVGQVTTLDPRPVSQFGDPAVKNYANVLFADNDWQNMGDGLFVPNGQTIPGAYNRQLTNLNGGYSSSHSDTHLWYHGTIDLKTPASDTSATITAAERQTWWTPFEAAGTNGGFLYSLIGHGDRLSSAEPAGTGKGRVNEGFNRVWELGGGVGANRSVLAANNGAWPNIIRFNVTGTNLFTSGQPIPVSFYYQSGSNALSAAMIRFYLDPDANPYNSNQTELAHLAVSGTGTNAVGFGQTSVPTDPIVSVPGTYFILAGIQDGPRTRYMYAPQRVILTPSRQAPLLTDERVEAGLFQCTISALPGQTVIIQGSTNFVNWRSLQTNVLTGTKAYFIDSASGISERKYYRGLLDH